MLFFRFYICLFNYLPGIKFRIPGTRPTYSPVNFTREHVAEVTGEHVIRGTGKHVGKSHC